MNWSTWFIMYISNINRSDWEWEGECERIIFCPIAHTPFVWTVKQQQDHASHFGAAAPPPRRCPDCRKQWRNRKQWHKPSAQRARIVLPTFRAPPRPVMERAHFSLGRQAPARREL